MLSLPAPAAGGLDGDRLRDELADAGLGNPGSVELVGDDLVFRDLTESHRSIVEAALSKHTSRPVAADPNNDLAARIQAVHDDPQVSASVKKLAAALLGLNGEAAVAGRPTDR